MKEAGGRKRASASGREGLKRQERAKEKILGTMPFIVWAKDREGRYLLVNEAYAAASGVRPEETVGKTDYELWGAEVAEAVRQTDIMAMESGETRKIEESFVDKTGKTVWVETIKGPLLSDSGEVIGTTGIARDITAGRSMQQALEECETRYREFADLLPNIVYEMDLDGRLVFVNRQGREAFGVPPDICLDDVNINFLKGMAPECREKALQGIQRLVSAGTTARDIEYAMRKHDGTEFPALVSAAPIIREGRPAGVRGTITDITRIKRDEAALKESEKHFRDLAELVPNIVFEVDLAGQVTFLNQRGFEYFKDPQATSHGKMSVSFLQGIAPQDRDRAHQNARNLISTGTGVRHSECVMQKYDGTTFPALISVTPIIRDGRPAGLRGTITDVTRLKKSEAALKESEQKWRELVHLLPEIVFENDPSGRITFLNQRGLQALGYTENELKEGISCLQVTAPEDHERAMRRFQELLTGRWADGPNEYRVVRKDGSTFPGLIHSAPIVREGEPVGIRGIVLDISDIRRSEAALKESEQKYRDLVNLLPEVLFETDASGIVTFTNERGLELFGYEGFHEGIHGLDFVAPEDREVAMERMKGLLTGTRMYGTNEYRMVRKDGSTFPGLFHGTPIVRDGKPVGIRGIVVDISDIRRSERALAESEARFRGLAQGSSVGVFMLNDQLLFEYINPAGAEMIGRTQEEVCGKLGPLDIVVAEDLDLVRGMGESQLSDTYPRVHFSVRIVKPDGTLRHIEVYGTTAVSNGHPVIVGTALDITERRTAEEARKESEEKYRMLMDDATDAIMLVSQDGKVQEVNKSASSLFECDNEELLGMNYADLHRGRESERIAATIDEVFADGYGSIPEFEAVTSKGRIVPTNLTWSILRYAGKWLVQLTFHDITERRQAEETVRRSEQTYRAIFEHTGTANLIIEEDGIISLANAEFVKMTGYTRADIEGRMRWEDFAVRHEGVASHGQLQLVSPHAHEGHTREDHVQRFRATIKGRREFGVDVVVTIAPIPGTSQKIYGLADISQLAYTEQVLKQSEERYRALVEQSSEGIATIDLRNRRVIEANETFLNILGYDQEDIRMFTIYDLLMENKGYIDNAIGRVIRKGRYFMGEQTLRGKNGTTAEVDMAAALVRYGDAMQVMISTRDITEKKQMEETLRQAQKMEALGTLAGGIAHDLNNILQVVTGFAYQLKQKTQQDPTAAKCVSEILGASQRGSNLTKSILTFSRKQPVFLQRLDVNDVVKGTERFLKRLVKENIEFRVECPVHELTVMVDRIQVEQILMNLVANASDAMPMGGALLLQTTVETLSEGFVKSHGFGKPGAYARISVADTGIGMDEETRKRIFEPFYSTKDASKNTGLGMSVVYGIVKQHNGYIIVESQPGMGTTIDVYLPLVAVGEGARSGAEEPASATAGTNAPASVARTILIAEDQPGVRAFLRGLLEESGYTVLEAEDGEKAVELFSAHKDAVDLVVLDLIMPVKDGKRAYDEMRAMREDIRAIFLSGYSDEITSDYGVQGGGFVLVSKPVLPPVLLEKIRELIDTDPRHTAG